MTARDSGGEASPAAPSLPVAAFDFDGTLLRGDSLWHFVRYALGDGRLLRLLVGQGFNLLAHALRMRRNSVAKARFLHAAFGRYRRPALEALGREFAETGLDPRLDPQMLANVMRHRALGHRLIVVSAALDLYLEPWARRHGFEACLCSALEFDADGRLTGALQGDNCFGAEKVARLRSYLGTDPAAQELHVYGDSRGDRELLQIATYAYFRGKRI